MRMVAHIVACHDEDILPFSVHQAARQFDSVIVAIGRRWWGGYEADAGDPEHQRRLIDKLCRMHGHDNVHVIVGDWHEQWHTRNGAIQYAASRKLLAPGDIVAIVDADELWPDEDIAKIRGTFNGDESLLSLAVGMWEFWSENRVRKGSQEEGRVARMRFWRYEDGAHFCGGNTMARAGGGLYPDCNKGRRSAKHARDVLGEPVTCYHYEATRPAWRMKLKYDAFCHRRGDQEMREKYFEAVWLRWQTEPETVEAERLGISTERTYPVHTIEVQPQHPESMAFYQWL